MFIRASAQVLPLTSMPKRAKLSIADFFGGLDQEAAGAAGRIADAVARLGAGQLGQQLGDLVRRVELAGLLAGVGGEAFDQVDVGVADDVLGNLAGAQVQLRAC